MQLGRNAGDVIDIGVEELEMKHALEHRHNGADVARQQHAQAARPAATPNQPIASPWVMKAA